MKIKKKKREKREEREKDEKRRDTKRDADVKSARSAHWVIKLNNEINNEVIKLARDGKFNNAQVMHQKLKFLHLCGAEWKVRAQE